jgi:hypothetical protein
MIKLVHVLGAVAAITVALPLEAQQRSAVQLTPYAGYMSFGSLVEGPLGSDLSHGGEPAFGAQLNVPLTSALGLYGNLAYAEPGLEVGLPGVGGVSVGSGSVLLYDGGLQLAIPGRTPGQISPFIQAGVGGMRYSFDLGPVQLNAANLAVNIGAGVALPLSGNLGLRVLAKDYIGTFDPGDVAGISLDRKTTHNWALSVGVTLGF